MLAHTAKASSLCLTRQDSLQRTSMVNTAEDTKWKKQPLCQMKTRRSTKQEIGQILSFGS
jgi:hypothetical protein